MKIVLHEKANWNTTPDHRGIIYVGDDDGQGYGDDGVTALGQIISPRVKLNGNPAMDGCHEFRPCDGCPDLSGERMKALADELARLDAETEVYLQIKANT